MTELNFNPTRNVTLLNGAQTESIISAHGKGFNDYIENRMKTWTTIASPFDRTTRFWDVIRETNKNDCSTARGWFQNLVQNPMQLALLSRRVLR